MADESRTRGGRRPASVERSSRKPSTELPPVAPPPPSVGGPKVTTEAPPLPPIGTHKESVVRPDWLDKSRYEEGDNED